MAWLFQDAHQVEKVGEKKAAWSVGWYEPGRLKRQKSFGRGDAGKKEAFRFLKQIEAQLLTGSYDSARPVSWSSFRKNFETDRASQMSEANRICVLIALENFERICNPGNMRTITRRTLDRFVAGRKKDRGRNPGSTVSPATVARDLRYLRAVLRVANEWGHLPSMPSMPRIRVPSKLPRFVTPEHFTKIYEACGVAATPVAANVIPEVWWRALLVFAYMTGWRIKELLRLKVADLDLDTGHAITRHADNKGKRDDRVGLHPLIVAHLRELRHFDAMVFPWPHGRRQIWNRFNEIQVAAGIALPCHETHDHTPSCSMYGFHDLRRGFATQNAENLTAKELQEVMRHRSFTTTLSYINMASQLKDTTTEKLFVPELVKKGGA